MDEVTLTVDLELTSRNSPLMGFKIEVGTVLHYEQQPEQTAFPILYTYRIDGGAVSTTRHRTQLDALHAAVGEVMEKSDALMLEEIFYSPRKEPAGEA